MALPVKGHRFAVFVPEDEQHVIAGHRGAQVARQLRRVAHDHLVVDQRHCRKKENQ